MARPWNNQKTVASSAGTPFVTNAETVLVTISGISTQAADGQVILEVVAQLSWGTGTTGAALRVRRGTDTTGAVVGSAVNENVIASQISNMELQVVDAPGEVAGQSYVVTIQQSGATGNGSNQQVSIQATY